MEKSRRLQRGVGATLALAVLVGCLCLLGLPREKTAEARIAESKIPPAQSEQPAPAAGKVILIDRRQSPQAAACVECHRLQSPGIHADWAKSRHAHAGVTCLDCHAAKPGDPTRSAAHDEHYRKGDNPWAKPELAAAVTPLVTPPTCARCHPQEEAQYYKSKHAHTWEIMWKIDPWLKAGLNSELERASGCYHCHGTTVRVKDGKLDPLTWPNVGVGRVNPDGSLGSCASCHTRHKFSVAEARKPETCGQCHLGPDHPQKEIYEESKHGAIYGAQGRAWNFNAPPGAWRPGADFRAPTCAACHMSGLGNVAGTHDVTERLSWELQAPLTVRPQEFAPMPALTDWKVERAKMQAVCRNCHGQPWTDDHFSKLDAVVAEYNRVYYQPAKAKLDELVKRGLLDPDSFFNTPLFTEFYELWHHEGRRARMGAAMMAPDYAWWHGFYECKKRLLNFTREADHLLATGEKAYRGSLPGGGGVPPAGQGGSSGVPPAGQSGSNGVPPAGQSGSSGVPPAGQSGSSGVPPAGQSGSTRP